MKKKKASDTRGSTFKIGSTSYIIPDDILPNVTKVAPYVDDIELCLFESDISLQFKSLCSIIDKLVGIAQNENISYTIHFPIDQRIGQQEDSYNELYYKQIKKLISITHPLNPKAYILHLDGIPPSASRKSLHDWRNNCSHLCEQIISLPSVDPEKICLENLNYPIEWFIDFLEMFGFSLCLDIGHLWMHSFDWNTIINQHQRYLRIVHLHGIYQNRDHRSLKYSPIEDISTVLSVLSEQFNGVLTLEVFSWKDLRDSLQIINGLL